MVEADGRPSDVHELNRQLADTIGASVEELLDMSNYSEANNVKIDAALIAARSNAAGGPPAGGGSTTEPPAAGGQPAAASKAPATVAQPTAPATAQEGEIDWESTKAANGLYLGKYKTKAAAVLGVANTVAMAKVAFTRADEVAAENARLARENETLRARPAVTPTAAPQVSVEAPPSRGEATTTSPKFDAVLSKLQENGNLDADDVMSLTTALREQAREEARRAVREEGEAEKAAAKAQSDRWGKVEAFMAEKYPESVNFTDELSLFIQTHPLIGAGVQALIAQNRHEEATAQAWEAYVLKNGVKPPFVPAPATRENVEREIRLEAADQVRREAVDVARRDAGVIPSTAGGAARGVHENAEAGPSQEEFDRSVALLHQGDGTQWRRLVFRDALNHPIFGE